MTPAKMAKAVGFKTLVEASRYTGGWSVDALNQMHKNHPIKFRTVLQGAAINKLNEALRGIE